MADEPLVIVHKEPGQILSSDEYGDTHPNTVPGGAENALLYVKDDETVATTVTPKVSKIGINQVTAPEKELEMAAGEGEFEYPVELLHRGQSQGNFGRHQNDRLEFLHAKLEETTGTAIADETGHWPGTFVGTIGNVTAGLPSGLSSAVFFDDETDYIDFGKIAMAEWEAMSFAVWVRVEPFHVHDWNPIGYNSIDTTSGPSGWQLKHHRTSGGRIYLYYGGAVLLTSVAVPDEVWVHVVGTIRRGREMRIYINGALAVSEILDFSTDYWSLDSGDETRLGLQPGTGYDGAMADARLFARAITQEEVSKIYAGGAGTLEPLRALAGPGDRDRWESVVFTATPTATYSVASTDARLVVGMPMRWMQVAADGWRYGIVAKVAAGTVSIAGAPWSTGSALIALEVGRPDGVVRLPYLNGGSYASGMSGPVFFGFRHRWVHGPAAAVAISVVHKTDDTGANPPTINLFVGGSAVSTANSGNGVFASAGGWTPDLSGTPTTGWVEVDPATAEVEFGDDVKVQLFDEGSNQDAVDLNVDMVFVLK